MREETTMMRELLVLFTLLAAVPAQADQRCTAVATEKNLAGPAKTNFIKKCRIEAVSAVTHTPLKRN